MPDRPTIPPKWDVLSAAMREEDVDCGRSRAIARRADDLLRRCSSGLRGIAFQAEVVRSIHAMLPVDAVFLATADPGTLLLTGIFAEEPLVGVADQFLDNEFGQDDVIKFQSLARGARHVATLDSATRGDRSASGPISRHHGAARPRRRASRRASYPRPAVGVTCACIGPSRRTGSPQPRCA